jgi:cytochrome P450
LLLPPFTPDEIAKIELKARRICNGLMDRFIADGHCDAAQHYSRHIPVRVIASMLGVPEDDGDLFIRWIHEILELGITNDEMMWKGLDGCDRGMAETHPLFRLDPAKPVAWSEGTMRGPRTLPILAGETSTPS